MMPFSEVHFNFEKTSETLKYNESRDYVYLYFNIGIKRRHAHMNKSLEYAKVCLALIRVDSQRKRN